ncbi:MAG: SIMPL domain-containing protein [Actinomycetota bacterium]|nr:SIMPL domain-containing protein [Actinomycetota bacterium]
MRTITVTGHGTAYATPDTAEVRVAAVHRDSGLSEALAGAESAREGVVATSCRYVDASRVASTNLSVWPAHDHEGLPSGYEARHSLTIRCDDLAQAGALVTALAADVGHRLQVESVSLVVADPSRALRLARERAFADARARGEHLAGLARATLGQVQSVTEGGSPSEPMPVVGDLRAVKAEASFEPGETAVPASLTVVFELAPAG